MSLRHWLVHSERCLLWSFSVPYRSVHIARASDIVPETDARLKSFELPGTEVVIQQQQSGRRYQKNQNKPECHNTGLQVRDGPKNITGPSRRD